MKKLQRLRNTSKPRTPFEEKLLLRIGRKVHKELYDSNKSIEWLAWEAEIARSTVQRVFEAKYNLGIITLDRIARALGYSDAIEFLKTI